MILAKVVKRHVGRADHVKRRRIKVSTFTGIVSGALIQFGTVTISKRYFTCYTMVNCIEFLA